MNTTDTGSSRIPAWPATVADLPAVDETADNYLDIAIELGAVFTAASFENFLEAIQDAGTSFYRNGYAPQFIAQIRATLYEIIDSDFWASRVRVRAVAANEAARKDLSAADMHMLDWALALLDESPNAQLPAPTTEGHGGLVAAGAAVFYARKIAGEIDAADCLDAAGEELPEFKLLERA